jgi:hypothetical protein
MREPKRLTPQQALALLRNKWDAHHASWLVSSREEAWPLTVVLHDLTERHVSSSLAHTREWVQAWRAWDPGGCSVEWASRRWPSGDQELPMRLVVSSAEAAAAVSEPMWPVAPVQAAVRPQRLLLAEFIFPDDLVEVGYLYLHRTHKGEPRFVVFDLRVEDDFVVEWIRQTHGSFACP